MGRRLPTKVPAVPSVLKPNVQDTDRQRVRLREDKYRSKQQIYHDKRHKVRALPSLTTGERVWVRDQSRESQILGATKQPRSYLVKTEMGTVRSNRSAIASTSSQPAFPSNGANYGISGSSTACEPHVSKGFYPRPREPTG